MSVISIGGSAQAQAPAQAAPVAAVAPAAVTPVFLERRVPDELATDGIVLSRQGLALKVEQVGRQWLVSLVDLNTNRVAASTKLDELAADREAAVATMTHIVAELASQITGREPLPVAAPPAASTGDLVALAARQQAAQDARDAAELSYRRKAIHFGSELMIAATGSTVSVGRLWTIRQGELDQPMEAVDFYKAVNRPDLYERYRARHNAGVGLTIAGWSAIAVGLGIELVQAYQLSTCASSTDPTTGVFTGGHCFNGVELGVAIGLTTVGITLEFIGVAYRARPHPIDEGEAKALADKYNQGLRRQLGLPTVSERAPRLRDVKLAPFAGSSGGGLALGGRF